ncbi:MAG TPA: hypothetical protein VLI94_10315 [Solirubrobacterales bacterium]|nr:hypothetical protein [Solirubrobacterales bacterium]
MAEPASLAPFETRVRWARKYAEELKEACDGFMKDNEAGSAMKVERDSDVGRLLVTVHLPDGFPEDLGRIVGGGLHQLRSALDNLAYQLVLTNGGTPTKSTAFPILLQPPDGGFAANTKKRLEGMSGTARAAIEGLQPYNAWPEHPDNSTIWLIHELNNIDKHRISHLACLWISTFQGRLLLDGSDPEDIGVWVAQEPWRGIAEHGAMLLDVRWDPALLAKRPSQKMMMNVDSSSDVALRNPERGGFLDFDMKTIDAMPIQYFFHMAIDYCETVVTPAFAGEFQ